MPSTARIAWRRSSLGPAPAESCLNFATSALALEREGQHVALERGDSAPEAISHDDRLIASSRPSTSGQASRMRCRVTGPAGAGAGRPARERRRCGAALRQARRPARAARRARLAARRTRLVRRRRRRLGRRRPAAADRGGGRRRRGGRWRQPQRRARLREHARDHELELQPRRGRAGHVVERRDDEVGGARQARRAEDVGLARHAGEVFGRDAAQHGGGALAGRGDDDEVAQPLEQVVDEPARILAGLHDAVDRGEGGRGIRGAERVDHLVEQLGVRVAEQRDRALVR